MKDKDFLQWVHGRLHYGYKENPRVDHMTKLQCIINDYDPEKCTANIMGATRDMNTGNMDDLEYEQMLEREALVANKVASRVKVEKVDMTDTPEELKEKAKRFKEILNKRVAYLGGLVPCSPRVRTAATIGKSETEAIQGTKLAVDREIARVAKDMANAARDRIKAHDDAIYKEIEDIEDREDEAKASATPYDSVIRGMQEVFRSGYDQEKEEIDEKMRGLKKVLFYAEAELARLADVKGLLSNYEVEEPIGVGAELRRLERERFDAQVGVDSKSPTPYDPPIPKSNK